MKPAKSRREKASAILVPSLQQRPPSVLKIPSTIDKLPLEGGGFFVTNFCWKKEKRNLAASFETWTRHARLILQVANK